MPDADWKTAGSARKTLEVQTRCSLESGGLSHGPSRDMT